MAIRCVALFSGGLDSMLAVRMMQEQDIEVHALNFKTIFTCCQDQSAQHARLLDVPLTVIGQEDDYLDLVRAPMFGYGKGANPCVDCRIYMFRKGLQFMQQIDAHFVVSGEVIGQRPMSQKKRDLLTISHHSDLEDLLLRPLSAKALPETLPEREGWVDRERLFGYYGRGRKPLIALARKYNFPVIPQPSTGCALTEPQFSRKVFDLVHVDPSAERWDFELLKYGRHFRRDVRTKVIVGRQENDNAALRYAHLQPEARSTALLEPVGYPGPTTLLIGPDDDGAVRYAAEMLVRFSSRSKERAVPVRVTQASGESTIEATCSDALRAAESLTTATR